jgi:hypothetical protein
VDIDEESQTENESPNIEAIAKKLLDGGVNTVAIPSQSSKESAGVKRSIVRERLTDLASE